MRRGDWRGWVNALGLKLGCPNCEVTCGFRVYGFGVFLDLELDREGAEVYFWAGVLN